MFTVKGYLANKQSPLDGGAFSVRMSDAEEFVAWLKNETDNDVTAVIVDLENCL